MDASICVCNHPPPVSCVNLPPRSDSQRQRQHASRVVLGGPVKVFVSHTPPFPPSLLAFQSTQGSADTLSTNPVFRAKTVLSPMTLSSPPASSPPSDTATESELDVLGRDLSGCVLEQYVFTIMGIGLGTGMSVYRKSFFPLVAWGAAGSIGDLMYGLGYACKGHYDAYKACRNKLYRPGAPPIPPPPSLG